MDFSNDIEKKKRNLTTNKKKKKKGFFGKLIDKKKAFDKKRVKTLKKVGKGAAKFIKKTAGATLLAPLFPFKKAIDKGLKKKGVDPKGMKFPAKVEKFYNLYVSKKAKKTSNYEPIEMGTIENDPAFRMSLEEFEQTDNAIGTAVVTVVSSIIDIFKAAKKKKSEKGEKAISSDEKFLAEETENVQSELAEKENEEKPVEQKSMKKYLIIGGVILVLGLILFLVLRKK